MSRNYQRDERDWPRQQQNWPEQNRWSGGRREDEQDWRERGHEGRNWRNDEYERGGQDWGGGRWRGQGIEGMNQGDWRGGNERDMYQGGGGGHRWGSERNWEQQRNFREPGRGNWQSDQGWDRGAQNWQQGRGSGQGDRGWDRENWQTRGRGAGWQGDQSRGIENRQGGEGDRNNSGWGAWNEPYEGLGGRGWREGLSETMQGRGQYAGRGPRSYKRSDNRIEEDINDRLTQHPMIDASDIEVSVQNGEITLRGHVDNRDAKRLAEDIAESVFGAKEVNNQIRVKQRNEFEETRHETETSGKQRKAG